MVKLNGTSYRFGETKPYLKVMFDNDERVIGKEGLCTGGPRAEMVLDGDEIEE